MGVIGVKPTDDVVAVAEDGTPVTGKMIQEWCVAYDRGDLPAGYEFDGTVRSGRPRLANEATNNGCGTKRGCMEFSTKVIRVGEDLGIELPMELLDRCGFKIGDSLVASELPDGRLLLKLEDTRSRSS